MKRRALFRSLVGMAAAPVALAVKPAPKTTEIRAGASPYCKCGVSPFVVGVDDESQGRFMRGIVQCPNKECDQYGVRIYFEYGTMPSRPATAQEIKHYEAAVAEENKRWREASIRRSRF